MTVAASLFPRYAREGQVGVATALHRISRVYAVLALAVPVFGIATGLGLGQLGDAWLIASMILTLVAGLLLALVVLPEQGRVMARLDGGESGAVTPRLGMVTGVFALIWAIVVVLMIVRPGSTTGVLG